MRRAPSTVIIGRSGACLVCVFAFFPRRKARRRAHAPPCTSSTIAHCKLQHPNTERCVKRQFTITHVGERWVDSGGESWAELSALKMKWIESTQGKILAQKYLPTVVRTQTRPRSQHNSLIVNDVSENALSVALHPSVFGCCNLGSPIMLVPNVLWQLR